MTREEQTELRKERARFEQELKLRGFVKLTGAKQVGEYVWQKEGPGGTVLFTTLYGPTEQRTIAKKLGGKLYRTGPRISGEVRDAAGRKVDVLVWRPSNSCLSAKLTFASAVDNALRFFDVRRARIEGAVKSYV